MRAALDKKWIYFLTFMALIVVGVVIIFGFLFREENSAY